MRTILIAITITIAFASCCKEKNGNICSSNQFQVMPFVERYGNFSCGGNLYEYQYVLRRESEIDSLSDCFIAPPIPFPIDETDFVYIMIGKMAYHYRDTFETLLLKDTCNKKLVYQVDMIQQDTALNTFPGVVSMFCSAENIPSGYQVEVKYKYVPLPE